MTPFRAAVTLVLILALGALMPGCALLRLQADAALHDEATIVVGRIAAPAGWHGDVIVGAASLADRRLVHRARLHEPGGYELIVPPGEHAIVAFGDRDGDGAPGPDEPAALHATPVAGGFAPVVTQVDLVLGSADPAEVAGRWPGTVTPLPDTQAGALARWDDEPLSADTGVSGYWQPAETFRRVGGNIRFVEPYDPARVPVLFIHGAVGSAQDFRTLVARLDRRYQAWLFHYPSGASLDAMAHLLYWKLLNLQLRHRFEQLHIVAHSMGGLVARRFLLDHGQHFPQLRSLITLSTPWGGDPAAVLGVRHAPAVVPSWRDLQPDGAFLTRLFEQPLPARIEHTLLFGHRGRAGLGRPSSDGIVALASQLQPQAQAEARLVMGFDQDHDGILQAPDVIAQVMRRLAARSDGGGGRLRVPLPALPADVAASSHLPLLALRRLDDPAASGPLLFPLAPGTSNDIGPLPPGRYEARIAMAAHRAEPGRRVVTIAERVRAEAPFLLTPHGALLGTIEAERTAPDRPAGSPPQAGAALPIRRIVLEGPSGRRELIPRDDGDSGMLAALIDGRDDAVGPYFGFVDLEPGEHVLTIEADGHRPHVSRHAIAPGRPPAIPPIVLRRERNLPAPVSLTASTGRSP
ncbi:MAG: esterase/lipase family protein [Lautropia sp.]